MGLCGCSPSVPDTLKISMLVPQTGPFELRGKDLINGAQLAVDEIDASGYKIRGKPVKFELVTVDDKGEVDAATQGAQKLVADGVLAAIGPLNTPQAAPVVPIFAAAGTPHFLTAKDSATAEMAAKIKAANADLVVLFAREPQLLSLFAALKQVGHTDVTVLATNMRFTETGEQRYPNIGFYKAERGVWRLQMVSASW